MTVDDVLLTDNEEGRPPICPACGVTMGIVTDDGETTRFACLECGFSDHAPAA